jgi:hypothetical protein
MRETPTLTDRRRLLLQLSGGVVALGAGWPALAAEPRFPITAAQRATATQVAEAGVPLDDLAPGAPDSYTVKRGDTLWDISKLFLRSPWRWPQLWGMNLDQIRNPHLIFPGQLLLLDKSNGRARLRVAQGHGAPTHTLKISPSIRSEVLENGAIASIPLHLIGPFLNEAIVFESNDLERAPRIVATQEGRVMLSRGELAYVRGELGGAREFRIFREAMALRDPDTQELLGYEAPYVGTAELLRAAGSAPGREGEGPMIVPATFRVGDIRQEAGIGDRLWQSPARDWTAFMPHAPAASMDGRVVSIYGHGVKAGQNQIVALNRGLKDGMERGHVLALWRAGTVQADKTDPQRTMMRLPDEPNGLLFVFRVFERVSYALIVSGTEPVSAGDRFSQP